MNKAAFFDRDGTINVEVDYLHSKEDMIFIDGMPQFIKKWNDKGYKVIVITNQAGIARGYYAEDDMHELHNYMNEELIKYGAHIDAFYFCPHHPDITGDCNCRKPKTGMIEQAIKDFNIDVTQSILFGDKPWDVEAGEKCGIKSFMEITEISVPQNQEDYAKFIVPTWKKPLVSIIIPVYNQFDYTYKCIESIVKNSGAITYEILIADDSSNDLTTGISDVISGLVVIVNPINLRFLKNCNNAAKYAKGNYILFLNNDTQVQENWLEPLVTLIESKDDIGMVGSKLVYPDGRLQEAGGILWKDGSAWNYGRCSNPEDPEYNYVKEVDYISGAAIMIRKSLWNKIGGFDECFSPAYYEDTDLAFEVRRSGYKVLYQPLSVVVHFEGASNGIDISEGQKAYQVINQKKFYEKWKDVLEKEHKPNGEDVFIAKDKTIDKKHILVVDHSVPHHDKDAGGKCTYMYIKLFLSMGLKVTFIGDTFFPHQPYTTELQQMGVEVLCGNYYYNNWKEWLKENSHYFDYAYLNRAHIAIKYIDLLKKYSNAKIIYFGHDLHYLRNYRQYLIDNDFKTLKLSQQSQKWEFELFIKTDIIYVVGSYEQNILQKEFPNKYVRNIPVYIFETLKSNISVNTNFKKRENLIFVGGFGHSPNIDAVLWFASEIFPYILKVYPSIKWYIVGSNVPQNVLNLKSDNIIVTGFISDEELEELYSVCRMSVAPLRIGAGVKGKVVDALYNRIPLVTTPIGAEGLSLEENAFLVCEPDISMAEEIIALYKDYNRLKELSENSKKFIKNHFTKEIACKVVQNDINYKDHVNLWGAKINIIIKNDGLFMSEAFNYIYNNADKKPVYDVSMKIANFESIPITEELRFHIDNFTKNEYGIHIGGWAFVEDKLSDNQQIYIKITDKTGQIYTYDTTQSSRDDVGIHFNDDQYSFSGFSTTIKSDIDLEGAKVNIIIENDGLFMSQAFNYIDNNADKKPVDDVSIKIENFESTPIAKGLRFNIDDFTKNEDEIHIEGWAFVEDKLSDNQQIYIKITDKSGKIYTYKTSQSSRNDVGTHFNDAGYNFCGFSVRIKEMAIKDFDIDVSKSILFGDKPWDVEAGEKCGIKSYNVSHINNLKAEENLDGKL